MNLRMLLVAAVAASTFAAGGALAATTPAAKSPVPATAARSVTPQVTKTTAMHRHAQTAHRARTAASTKSVKTTPAKT